MRTVATITANASEARKLLDTLRGMIAVQRRTAPTGDTPDDVTHRGACGVIADLLGEASPRLLGETLLLVLGAENVVSG